MPGGDDETLGAEKGKLEMFDGTQPSGYRKWKRRAQLMLASLPSTISEKKYGPKLMSFIGGEAESLLEHIDIGKICSEGGDKLIWEALDEKYGPQQIDLLQDSLKGFFYELSVKQGESFRQFAARFAAARRKLEEQDVKLPKVVLGFMLMKKLRLDPHEESMLLTTTGGNLELERVEKAVQAVFPEGKGHATKGSTKEVFQADAPSENDNHDEEELQQAMELMAEEIQSRSEWDEEDILEAFESYSEIRKKIAEQKKGRGFYPKPAMDKTSKQEGWNFSGSIKGRIEQLKSRTRCHRCKKFGHWKKECPLLVSAQASSSGSTGKEVMIIENGDDPAVKQIWESFITEDYAKTNQWGEDLPNDVRNQGNADSHSTGNRQRSDEPSVVCHVERRWQPCEVFQGEVLLSDGLDSQLAICGVPDTACRRTLVGKDTLAMIESELNRQGAKVLRARATNQFRFGNSGTIQSEETVLLPANIAGKRFIIKAAVLPEGGKETPLLLSKELLKQLGCVMDLNCDVVWFDRLKCKVKLRETGRGHYAIPLFESVHTVPAADCFNSEGWETERGCQT